MSSIGLGSNRYGKANVKFLRVKRETPRHEIKEIRARMLLEGKFEESYTTGSNASVVPTDTQKNSLYAFAKKYDVEPIEEWALLVSKDMLSRHSHVDAVHLKIEEYPWDRITVNGKQHNHAFQKASSGIRFLIARIPRNGKPTMVSGFKELSVMKTTQSGFEGYIRDEYTTLPETRDRVFATKMKCSYTFNDSRKSIAFTKIHDKIKEICLNIFAGNPETGVYSPSVQQTLYQAGKQVLETFPELEKVSFVLPNIHYFVVDFKAFKTNLTNNNEVLQTYDGPNGHIEATIERKDLASQKAKL